METPDSLAAAKTCNQLFLKIEKIVLVNDSFQIKNSGALKRKYDLFSALPMFQSALALHQDIMQGIINAAKEDKLYSETAEGKAHLTSLFETWAMPISGVGISSSSRRARAPMAAAPANSLSPPSAALSSLSYTFSCHELVASMAKSLQLPQAEISRQMQSSGFFESPAQFATSVKRALCLGALDVSMQKEVQEPPYKKARLSTPVAESKTGSIYQPSTSNPLMFGQVAPPSQPKESQPGVLPTAVPL